MVGNDLALDEGIGTCGKDGQSVPVGVGMPTIRSTASPSAGRRRERARRWRRSPSSCCAARAQHGATAADVVVAEGDSLDGRRPPRRGREGAARPRQAPRPARLRRRAQRRSSRPPTSRAPSLEQLAADAVALARVTAPDPFSGLPDASELATALPDCSICSIRRSATSPPSRPPSGARKPRRRRATPTRASPTPRAPSSTPAAHLVLYAASNGFSGSYRSSSCSLSVRAGGDAGRHAWSATTGTASQRHLARSISPAAIGRTAAARALRRLGARQVDDLRGAGRLRSRHGGQPAAPSRRRGLGQRPLPRHCRSSPTSSATTHRARRSSTSYDDGTLPRGLGSKPFDGEGLPTRRTPVIESGVLTSYLFDTYSARKLQQPLDRQRRRARSATRRTSARPTSSCAAGTASPDEIIALGRDRPLRHRADGLRRQPDHRRLLARRHRPVDRERRARLPGRARSPSPATCCRCSATSRWSATTS